MAAYESWVSTCERINREMCGNKWRVSPIILIWSEEEYTEALLAGLVDNSLPYPLYTPTHQTIVTERLYNARHRR